MNLSNQVCRASSLTGRNIRRLSRLSLRHSLKQLSVFELHVSHHIVWSSVSEDHTSYSQPLPKLQNFTRGHAILRSFLYWYYPTKPKLLVCTALISWSTFVSRFPLGARVVWECRSKLCPMGDLRWVRRHLDHKHSKIHFYMLKNDEVWDFRSGGVVVKMPTWSLLITPEIYSILLLVA
jgi:hypothetical protein